jgi:hypothetical protein
MGLCYQLVEFLSIVELRLKLCALSEAGPTAASFKR